MARRSLSQSGSFSCPAAVDRSPRARRGGKRAGGPALYFYERTLPPTVRTQEIRIMDFVLVPPVTFFLRGVTRLLCTCTLEVPPSLPQKQHLC